MQKNKIRRKFRRKTEKFKPPNSESYGMALRLQGLPVALEPVAKVITRAVAEAIGGLANIFGRGNTHAVLPLAEI